MRRTTQMAILGLLGTGLLGCGSGGSSDSPQGACKKAMAAECSKMSSCNTLSGSGFTSVSQCTSALQSSMCTGTTADCDPGQTFHADKVQACVDAIAAGSCTDSAAPAACSAVCQ